MKLSTPRWWYRRKPPAPITRLLLRPLSWIWAETTAAKLRRAKPLDPGIPVICVGNLTLGGTGKTPVVAALLSRLRRRGVDAQGLSRGYGGKEAGPLRVDPACHTAAQVGDEPLMLAAEAPVWISRDRAAGARAMAESGAQLIVMDDGHQNPSLRKTLALVVVDGETRNGEWPFGDGAVFPAGPMRESLATGLSRADAVVLMLPSDLPAADPDLLTLLSERPVLICRLAPVGPPPAGKIFAFAGVGKPWKVERSLVAAGADLADFVALPDHAPYDEGMLKALLAHAQGAGATLLTTAKDHARLPPQWRARVAVFPVEARFEDEAALDALLARTLA
ncbi:MAG: lpxK [Caulobacteraceae bacterium]|nr:lpxK [Caulobacteraceae bacterium]